MVTISNYFQTANMYHFTLHVSRQDLTFAWFSLMMAVALQPKFVWSVLVESLSLAFQIVVLYLVADYVVVTLGAIPRLQL